MGVMGSPAPLDHSAWADPTTAVPAAVVVRPRTVFALVLDDEKFGGLQIKVRSQTFAEWTTTGTAIVWPGDDATEDDKNKYFRDLVARFASYIVWWNLTDENGQPEPIGATALHGLDRAVVMDLFAAWNEAQSGKITAPLDRPSPGGEPSVEASIPVDGA